MSIIGNAGTGLLGAIGGDKASSSANTANNGGSRSFADVMGDVNGSALDKFMKYQQMTPAEKYRASFLSEMGLTEDDVKSMSADDQMKLESKIAERIKQKLAESLSNKTA